MSAAKSVTATFTANSSPKIYQLSWNPVTDPRVTGYKLYYSTSPLGGGATPASVNVGNNTTTTFDPATVGIPTGATVFFGVTAVASGLESPLSNTVSAVIQ